MPEKKAIKSAKPAVKKSAKAAIKIAATKKAVQKQPVKTIAKTIKAVKTVAAKPTAARPTDSDRRPAIKKPPVVAKKIPAIDKYRAHKSDTGSTKVQIAQLTEKVKQLTKHLELHQKDTDSRRGLLMMVGQRARLLKYLQKSDKERYESLIKKLGIRK